MPHRTYLDYAASAPLRPQAQAAMLAALQHCGNPSSIHHEGQAARALLDDARRAVADILTVRAERIVLTSGGTEAANMAVLGAPTGTVLVGATEHDCVLAAAQARGGEVIPVNDQGVINLAWLEQRLQAGGVSLVTVMLANNETGTLQPVAEVAALARRYGALSHTDAVQVVGHHSVNVDELGVDMLSFTAHKFGGPRGAGALVLKSEVKLAALIQGGGQERNRRAGTENACGMAAALQAATSQQQEELKNATQFATFLEQNLPKPFQIASVNTPKIEHVRMLIHPKIHGEDMVIALDLQGIAVSQGSACSSGRNKPSHVLTAMGLPNLGVVRVSWGWGSTFEEMQRLVAMLALCEKK
ncbi:MAG: cysteine desulfurase [Proteobacteria bacterium]|nr:cysteine desulfurase [Pseudomonadota bacterium]